MIVHIGYDWHERAWDYDEGKTVHDIEDEHGQIVIRIGRINQERFMVHVGDDRSKRTDFYVIDYIKSLREVIQDVLNELYEYWGDDIKEMQTEDEENLSDKINNLCEEYRIRNPWKDTEQN